MNTTATIDSLRISANNNSFKCDRTQNYNGNYFSSG